jgi:integrase
MSASALHGHLDMSLGVKEALGFQMRAERTLLRDFVRFVEARGAASPRRVQTALDWACAPSARRGRAGQAARLRKARGFLSYLRAIIPATEVPHHGLVPDARRPPPSLLTPQQLQGLIGPPQERGPPKAFPLHTCTTVIGLLASTGLRVGAALRLTLADGQLEGHPPQRHVRETTLHTSRLVPLHPTTADALRRYAALRTPRDCGNASDAFCIGAPGQPLSDDALRRWLTTRRQPLGLAPPLGGRRPTLHALRHTFAVRRMQLWYQAGGDVQARLPHLSVSLGHVRPQESSWYLTATPDLLVAAAERFQGSAPTGGVQ